MLKRLFTTNSTNWTPLLLRFALGLVFLPHGAQKLLGWFGGYGFTGTMGFFTGTMHIPALFAFLAIFTEFFGALALISGLLTRMAAAGVAVIMAVAVFTVHLPHGFFMNWNGTQKGEGIEYHVLAGAIALALVIAGGGRYSIDAVLAKKLE